MSTEHVPTAAAYSNGDFILVETKSGYGRMRADPEAPKYFLVAEALDDEIGNAVVAALSRSRQLELEETAAFFDPDRAAKSYANKVADMMGRYSYKTKRALFKNMMNISIGLEKSGTVIRFTPMRHKALDSWIREKDDGIEDVIVPATSSPTELGAAFRIALSRCR